MCTIVIHVFILGVLVVLEYLVHKLGSIVPVHVLLHVLLHLYLVYQYFMNLTPALVGTPVDQRAGSRRKNINQMYV